MELHVSSTLKWRLQAVTPFSFVSYFLDKFNGGKPPSFTVASRCAEIIVGTLKGLIDTDLILPDDLNAIVLTRTSACNGFTGPGLLSFRPSEIAAAAALKAVSENQVLGSEGVLEPFEIPVNKVILD
jgi:cyclin D1/2/4, plant